MIHSLPLSHRYPRGFAVHPAAAQLAVFSSGVAHLVLVRHMTTRCFVLLFSLLLLSGSFALATSNYEYGADEYVTVASGVSSDGKFAITAHGTGYLGYDNFHLYLTDAITGKAINPLEEIVDARDTNADAFAADWSLDSREVTIVYRVGRPLKAVTYRISGRRARRVRGPFDVKEEVLVRYWQSHCSQSQHSPKIFGTERGYRP